MGTYYNDNGDLKLISGATLWADAPIGAINAYGGATAPNGWLLCQGQAISRTDYAELFAVIGTAYGSGDGSTTFNVPDFRDKFLEGASTTNPVGTEKSAGLPNIKGGVDSQVAGSGTQGAGAIGVSGQGFNYGTPAAGSSWGGTIISLNAHNSNEIYSDSVNTVQPPAICTNFIIKAKQVALPADFMNALDDKQDATDNNLETTSKQIVGAINELKDDLTDISTDGTIKSVIWQDSNIQENLNRNLPFVMPEDGYVVVRAGAANNYSTTMLTLVITINNSLRVAEILLEEPYAEAALSTPYLKKGTPVLINVIMNADSWTSETRGIVDFTII